MQTAACAKSVCLRHLKCFGYDTLSRERGVAVNKDRKNFLTLNVATTLLACSNRTFNDGVDDFQVRRIEGQRNVHIAARRFHVGRKSLVIFDVARAFEFVQVVVTLELLKQLLRRLAEYVHEHVDATAVRHTDNDFANARLTAFLNQVIDHRDHAFTAFERKAFLPDITGVQVALDSLGTRELLENQQPVLVCQHFAGHALLETFA